MHYGSGTGFGSGSEIKFYETKSEKILNERPTVWEIMQLLTFKRQDFVQIFSCGSGTGIKTFPTSEPQP
jgi:hypothetical protein